MSSRTYPLLHMPTPVDALSFTSVIRHIPSPSFHHAHAHTLTHTHARAHTRAHAQVVEADVSSMMEAGGTIKSIQSDGPR